MNSETKKCQNCHKDFIIEPEDFSFYEKMHVPAPKICPECRLIRRMMWRNEQSLYTAKCALCGEFMISAYAPSSPSTIYCWHCYRSEKWNPRDYFADYDFSRPFFEQFKELTQRIPKCSIYSDDLGVNTKYVNFAGFNKNGYLLFNSGHNEDSMYSRGIASCREVIDSYFCNETERAYEGVNVQKGSGVRYGQNSTGDIDSWFMLNTSGCQNCFGCVNERHASYSFFGEKLLKKDFEKRVNEIVGSHSKTERVLKKFSTYALKFPFRENMNIKTVDSTGDYLFRCKNAKHCFESFDCENCKYCHFLKHTKDSYDALGFGYGSELLLETVGVGRESQRIIGSVQTATSRDIFYSSSMLSSNNCFGCEGLKNAEYSILNKQYTKEEYEETKKKIIKELTERGEFGLFFPLDMSPFAYNETIAQDNFPLTKEEVQKRGYRWQEDIQKTVREETLKPEEIPDHISDVSDSITEEILRCLGCSRNYKIIPNELQSYRKFTVPLPRKCFQCRHIDRIRRRGPMRLFGRKCSNCQKDILTTYNSDRPEIVYCEQCYQNEVV